MSVEITFHLIIGIDKTLIEIMFLFTIDMENVPCPKPVLVNSKLTFSRHRAETFCTCKKNICTSIPKPINQ